MPIFQIKDSKAKQVFLKSAYFKSEQELHDFFEANLEELLGVRLLEHKYDTQDGQIPDTLALDEENNPVIIEYKLGHDPAVLTQGLCYLNWVKDKRSHFELLVHNRFGKDVAINWANPRVILIAQGFDNRTLGAVTRFKDVELIKYVPYDQDILYLEAIYSPIVTKSEKEQAKGKNKELASEETYDIDYHLSKSNPDVKDMFLKLQEKIKLLPSVDEAINQKTGITYRTTRSFARLEFAKNHINVLLKKAQYDDPKGLVKDITSFAWGYEGRARMTSTDEVDYMFDLIQKSYEQTL